MTHPHRPTPTADADRAREVRPSRCRPSMAVALLSALLLLPVLLGGCSGGIDARLEHAYELQEAGRLEELIVELRGIVDEDADNADANFMLGAALAQVGRQRLAIEPLTIAARDDTYAVPAGLLLAATQLRTRSYVDAIDSANRVLSIDPENVTALFTRGRALLATGRAEGALQDAERLLAIQPDSANGLAMKASTLVELDRRDEAEAIWIDLRARTKEAGRPVQAARACGQLALFYRANAEHDRAEEVYGECLSEFPTQAFLQKSASEFFTQIGQPDRAIEVLRDGIDASPDDIRAWRRLASALYDLGRPDEARKALEEMVDRFDSPTAWRLLAEFHRKMRQTTLARKAVEEAILRTDRPSEAYLYSLADLLVEEGRLARAREIGQSLTQPSYRNLLAGAISLKTGHPRRALERLDTGLALWSDNAHAHYLAGEAALQSRDRRRAVLEFREAFRLGNDTTDAALRLAELHFARGEYRIAARIARYQIENRPFLDATPYHIAIRSLLQLDRVDEAIEVADALGAAEPTGAAVVVERSAIARVQGGPEASRDVILASGRDLTDPIEEPVLRALSTDLNALGRADEALERIEKALARDAGNAPLHDLHARVLSHLGRREKAEAATNRALEIDPEYAPALEMRAYFALEQGDTAKALAAMDAATDAAPDNSNYPYNAASIARQMGDTEGAIARLEESLARQPLFGPAANDLAWILATDKLDLERALRLAQIAIRQNQSTDTLTTLGWVQHQRGEYDDAIRSYRTALEADADQPSIRYHLGLSLSEAGKKREAVDVLDALVEGPEFPEIDAARAELARIKGS